MDLVKKAAYLKGLMDGLKIDNSTDKGKVFLAMYDLLEELCDAVADIDDDVSQVYDELDAIDEDMDDLEEAVFGEDYDEDDEDDIDDADLYDEAAVEYELTCPDCGATTIVDEDTLFNQEVSCEKCGHKYEIEFLTEDELEEEDPELARELEAAKEEE